LNYNAIEQLPELFIASLTNVVLNFADSL